MNKIYAGKIKCVIDVGGIELFWDRMLQERLLIGFSCKSELLGPKAFQNCQDKHAYGRLQ